MSHYNVYVITKDGDIDAALAPFDENLEVDPYIDVRKEDVVPNFRNRYSRLLVQWKENAARAAAKGNEEEAGRAKAIVADISHDLDLSDEEIYQRETDGQDLDEDGNILSTYNPDSKWDWYEEGGRFWNGIRTKDGRNTNQCLVSDVLLVPGSNDQALYEKEKRLFLIYTGQASAETDEEKKAQKENIWNPSYYFDHFGDADTFALCQIVSQPYAVLRADGTWVEPGEMGWWGVSSARPGAMADFVRGFAGLMQKEPQDYICTCVDCHI